MAVRFQGSGRFRKSTRDYSQLDLFADLPAEAVIEAASQPLTEATNGRHEPFGRLDFETWENHRPGLIEELVRANQLEPVLRQAQEQTGDLLFSSNSST